jgi:hypothetical protein
VAKAWRLVPQGVPFGAAARGEVEEQEVGLFLAHRVRVEAECEFGIRAAEL